MKKEKQLTAVEWLVNYWKKLQSQGEKMTWNEIIGITGLVKEMEKEQIINAYKADLHPCSDEDAEQWYNETFKQQEQ
jgi:hypothetical protein